MEGFGTRWSALLVLAVLLAAFCSCQEGYILSYPPFVVSTSPSSGANLVSVSSSIIVRFSEEMDRSSFDANSFRLGEGIVGRFSFDKTSIAFVPSEPLQYDSQYVVVISSDVRDAVGDHMAQSYTFWFRTGPEPPIIEDFQPKSGYEGDTVSIYGKHFGLGIGTNVVRIGNLRAHVVMTSRDSIRVLVPIMGSTGPISVTVANVTVTTEDNFVVLYHGMAWSFGYSSITSDLNDVVWSGIEYLAVGNDGAIVASPDAIVWTERQSGTNVNLFGVARHGGIYVVVGAGGTILTSDDGIDWSRYIWAPEVSFFDVTWGPGRFVIVGTFGQVLKSPDGYSWWSVETGVANWLYRVIYTGVEYAMVGSTGMLITTPDLTEWTTDEAVTRHHLRDAIRTTSALTVIGHYGAVFIRYDGGDWFRGVSNTLAHLLGVAGYEDRMVAVGTDGTVITSFDHGSSWIKRTAITSADLNGIVWGDGRYVAVGQNGIILFSN